MLAGGAVAEEGSPKELMEKDGIYARMVELQTKSQNWKLKLRKVSGCPAVFLAYFLLKTEKYGIMIAPSAI